MLLGCIADDFTGATDLAGMLVRHGMRTVQTIGIPADDLEVDADAVVIALKSRTAPAEAAVADSLAASQWLRDRGAKQLYFKYCSTFDSTEKGNIGPVADALLDQLGQRLTVFCPALPVNGRTVYKGHLFVGERLLNESGMQDHPLTPMTDPNLLRVLAAQTASRVGLIDHPCVARGPEAIREQMDALSADGVRMLIVDSTDDEQLRAVGRACAGLGLVTGGSGLAIGLPENFREAGTLASDVDRSLPSIDGPAAVIAGSCSAATREQVARMQAQRPAFRVDPRELAAGEPVVARALGFARDSLAGGPLLIYATAEPQEVRAVQAELGLEQAGALVEEALAGIASGLVALGVRRLVVAGGETSGAVVQALGVAALRIGPEIDPGVPWTATISPSGRVPMLALALKSGNFGSADFFTKAFARLPSDSNGAT